MIKLIVRIFFVVLCSFLVLPSLTYGKEIPKLELKKESAGVESLSPELRELLSKEMLALQKAMISIIPAYVAGNWDEIEEIADKMQNSYILKQSITEKQVKELHTLLADSFIKQDQYFHYLAGMLKHVAKNKKAELVGFYFSKLNEACLSCHTQYAIHKFPLLVPLKEINSHSH